MNLLPPRPLKLRGSFLAASFVGGPTALIGACLLILAGCIQGPWWLLLAAIAPAAWGVWALRSGVAVLQVAREGEEVDGEVVAPGQFRVGEAILSSRGEPLFLDDKETRVLALRAKSLSLVVRGDLWPFLLGDDEARAIRERIFERNQMRKLVNDIHTC